MVEEEIAKRYPEQEMRCPVHLSIGQEAAAVGVCSALRSTDWVFSGHRSHAHYLAKGGDLQAMLAEIYGKAYGCCGGRGGSMHLTDQAAGFIGATPIVGSTVPIAVGAAITAQMENKGRVVVVFLGDGAMETGVVQESLNYAALRKLPILFACENNLYSVYSPLEVRQPAQRSIADVAAGHGLKTIEADGNNVAEVYAHAWEAVNGLRNGGGAIFMELKTYRWLEHCGPNYDNNIGYRSEAEFEEWKARDPIVIASKTCDKKLSAREHKIIHKEINDAFRYAREAPYPEVTSSNRHIYSDAKIPRPPLSSGRRTLTYAEALREAQDICLAKQKECYLMGLGVPDPKGIFGTTLGLQDKYGIERVFDIPLSENAMTGVAIGSAITGLRPILTHQRLDFALVSIDQIVNQAAKWHYMFNGTMRVPMVIRMVIGRGWGQGPQHSQALHSWFGHIPGLKVIMPTTAYDAKGLLISAVEDDNPVLLLEHRWLHENRGIVPEEYYSLPLDKARIIREGKDITIIAVSYMLVECLRAAQVLQSYSISVEIVDLISIRPIDTATVLTSVSKTGRCIVVDQTDPYCSLSSEIIAAISENMLQEMKVNPSRLVLPTHPAPTSQYLSSEYYPTCEGIVNRVLSIMGWSEKYTPSPELMLQPKDQPRRGLDGPF
jgi:pyruvate/2-oxoglutarate/acetoin dehydrogenase E1 component/TPP-dependent pyruvate/acetoin dehydrogenase alpha subunit